MGIKGDAGFLSLFSNLSLSSLKNRAYKLSSLSSCNSSSPTEERVKRWPFPVSARWWAGPNGRRHCAGIKRGPFSWKKLFLRLGSSPFPRFPTWNTRIDTYEWKIYQQKQFFYLFEFFEMGPTLDACDGFDLFLLVSVRGGIVWLWNLGLNEGLVDWIGLCVLLQVAGCLCVFRFVWNCCRLWDCEFRPFVRMCSCGEFCVVLQVSLMLLPCVSKLVCVFMSFRRFWKKWLWRWFWIYGGLRVVILGVSIFRPHCVMQVFRWILLLSFPPGWKLFLCFLQVLCVSPLFFVLLLFI